MTRLLLKMISFYRRFLSPVMGQGCRFFPTCSEYARQAIVAHGPLKGSVLAFLRVCKCHPFHKGGVDPVPPRPPSARQLNPSQGRPPWL